MSRTTQQHEIANKLSAQPLFPGVPVAPADEAVCLPADLIGRRLQVSGYISLGLNLAAICALVVIPFAGPAEGMTQRPPVTIEPRWTVATNTQRTPRLETKEALPRQVAPKKSGRSRNSVAAAMASSARPTTSAATSAAAAVSPAKMAPAAEPAQPTMRERNVSLPATTASVATTTPDSRLSAAVIPAAARTVTATLPTTETAARLATPQDIEARAAGGPRTLTSAPTSGMGPVGVRPIANAVWKASVAAPVLTASTGDWSTPGAERVGTGGAPALRSGAESAPSVAGAVVPRTATGEGIAAAALPTGGGGRGTLASSSMTGTGPLGRRVPVGGGIARGGEISAAGPGGFAPDSIASGGPGRGVTAGGPSVREGATALADSIGGRVASGVRGGNGIDATTPSGNGPGALRGEGSNTSGPRGKQVGADGPGIRTGEGGGPNGPGDLPGDGGPGRNRADGKPERRPNDLGNGAQVIANPNLRPKDRGTQDTPHADKPQREDTKPLPGKPDPARGTEVIAGRDFFQRIKDVRVVRRVEPAIPESLRSENIRVSLKARFQVARDGSFTVSLPGTGYAELDTMVRAALNQWKFEPAYEDGQPVKGVYEVTIRLENK